jgi:hypothetical protein
MASAIAASLAARMMMKTGRPDLTRRPRRNARNATKLSRRVQDELDPRRMSTALRRVITEELQPEEDRGTVR